MANENKPNTGALFKNDRKEKDSHPDYNGNITLPDGRECWLSAWIKTSKNGKKYMSLSLRPKDDAPTRREETARYEEESDEIPF